MNSKMGVMFRGTKSGLTIVLDAHHPFPELLKQLKVKLNESGFFFANADVTLNIGARELDEKALQTLIAAATAAHGLQICGLKTSARKTAKIAEKLGLQVKLLKPQETQLRNATVKQGRDKTNLPAQLHRSTIRSGQIYESSGHLIILGDVNHGAEIVAAGDIIVFGSLRGNAFAGATGNKGAIVAALQLAPTLLRIDKAVARCAEKKSPLQKAEFAFIEKGQIVIDDWSNKNRLSINNGILK